MLAEHANCSLEAGHPTEDTHAHTLALDGPAVLTFAGHGVAAC
jgi:hypothetical protein